MSVPQRPGAVCRHSSLPATHLQQLVTWNRDLWTAVEWLAESPVSCVWSASRLEPTWGPRVDGSFLPLDGVSFPRQEFSDHLHADLNLALTFWKPHRDRLEVGCFYLVGGGFFQSRK